MSAGKPALNSAHDFSSLEAAAPPVFATSKRGGLEFGEQVDQHTSAGRRHTSVYIS
jgi:hypothetical protein